jgi:hypothetical protein
MASRYSATPDEPCDCLSEAHSTSKTGPLCVNVTGTDRAPELPATGSDSSPGRGAKVTRRVACPPKGVDMAPGDASMFREASEVPYCLVRDGTLRATRNPRKSYRDPGSSPLRPADRQPAPTLPRAPPRFDRTAPDGGP